MVFSGHSSETVRHRCNAKLGRSNRFRAAELTPSGAVAVSGWRAWTFRRKTYVETVLIVKQCQPRGNGSSPTLNESTIRNSSESVVSMDVSSFALGAESVQCEAISNGQVNSTIGRSCSADDAQQADAALPLTGLEQNGGCLELSHSVRAGETVLVLGSASVRLCFAIAQSVGDAGRVVGIEWEETTLQQSRARLSESTGKAGGRNIEFRKGQIYDLELDLERFDAYLQGDPCQSSDDFMRAEDQARRLRNSNPLVSTNSIDVAVSDCALNLVRASIQQQVISEMHRVLKRDGRVCVSAIVSDESVTPEIQNEPAFRATGLSSVFREDELLHAFETAGFHGIQILSRQTEPWKTLGGIEFRRLTVQAFKGKAGPCLERHQAVIYKGPWKAVVDDDGHTLYRGQRMAVCDKTFQIYSRAPYAQELIPISPRQELSLASAAPMPCTGSPIRDPRQTKSAGLVLNLLPLTDCCSNTSECC